MKPSLVDIHCHILPGVDDGAKDMDMALEMLRKEAEDGVSDIILTTTLSALRNSKKR